MVVVGGLVAKLYPTLATPWTVACQAPLSRGFSKQEYWSGLLFPSPGDLPHPGIKPGSPALQEVSLLSESPGKPIYISSILFRLRLWVAILCLVAQSCPTFCDPMNGSPPGSFVQGDSPGKNTGVGCHAFLQGIFPTQGLEPRSPLLQVDSLPAELPGKSLQPTPGFLPGEFHRQSSLVGYSPWGHKESDTTEWLKHISVK